MATTKPISALYTLRPGRASDVPHLVNIYQLSFANDTLIDILFPNRHTHPHVLQTYVRRLFASRYHSINYNLTVLASGATQEPVGFTWWKTPAARLTFWQRWLSPWAWWCTVLDGCFKVRDWLFPIRDLDEETYSSFMRTFSTQVEPGLLSTQRRKEAFYLSTLAVLPSLQGQGLGGWLMRDGLQKVDEQGAAAWLIGLKGIEPYYERYGFETKGRANVGDLSNWDGGAIMFRNE